MTTHRLELGSISRRMRSEVTLSLASATQEGLSGLYPVSPFRSFALPNGVLIEMAEETKTILVVDDEIPLARSLARVLERDKFQCLTAGSVDAAWELLKSHLVHLCLVDLAMPGKSGLDLMKMVRADPTLKDLPIIVISGFVDQVQDQISMCAPVGILRKPVPLDELQFMVREGLGLKPSRK